MSELPTLIILAKPADQQSTSPALAWFDSLGSCIMKGQSCGMTVMVVAPSQMARHATQFLDTQRVIQLSCADEAHAHACGDELIKGVAAAVLATAQSTGWLLVPADLPMLRCDTLLTMGKALHHHPVVFPEYRASRGPLVGFSAEFFSELIRLQCEHDFKRLIARYPALGIDVDDAGVLDHTNCVAPYLPQHHSKHALQSQLD